MKVVFTSLFSAHDQRNHEHHHSHQADARLDGDQFARPLGVPREEPDKMPLVSIAMPFVLFVSGAFFPHGVDKTLVDIV